MPTARLQGRNEEASIHARHLRAKTANEVLVAFTPITYFVLAGLVRDDAIDIWVA